MSVRNHILEVLEDAPDGLSSEGLNQAVQEKYQGGKRTPAVREITGRLSTLRADGVVEHLERGRYRLARCEEATTPLVQAVAAILQGKFRAKPLRRLVLWDATPYLELTEDGAPGTRIVIEHASAAGLPEMLERDWPGDQRPAFWTTSTKGPLGELLWEPTDRPAGRIDAGVVLVDRERIGGTGLTEAGYRAPFQERVLLEFLEMESDRGVPVIETLLMRSEADMPRLWASAHALGVLPDLNALLAGSLDRLPDGTANDFFDRLPQAVSHLIGGRK